MLPQRTKLTRRANDWRRAKREQLRTGWNSGPNDDVFLPGVGLDPNRVRDIRTGQPLLESIALWFHNVAQLPGKSLPKNEAKRGSPFYKLQQSYRQYNAQRMVQPMPGPSPRTQQDRYGEEVERQRSQPRWSDRPSPMPKPTSSPNSLLGQYRR